MFIEKLPSKLIISRDLTSQGYIIEQNETPAATKNFTYPFLKLTETVEIDGEERQALISESGYETIETFANALADIFGGYGYNVAKATTEWSDE